jgi:hypothetical protein
MNYAQSQPPVVRQDICDRCGRPPPVCTCCELVCFERPKYHCGHLLTDADLSLQVKYQVEKNKLRNRALHGHGVVCGLKLTCDPCCNGHIVVHDGYAIDDCGNDIIVCEKQSFDVVGALRAKGLIWDERRDPCEWDDGERECRIKECFYVLICYDEEDCRFETPFQAGCATGPQDCVATRTRETFRLEVTDRLPEECSYLDWLENRLKHCFRLFRDNPVGRLMKERMREIREVMECKEYERERQHEVRNCQCELFRMLRGFFIEQIRLCPDELDCCLLREVECLHCPELDRDNYAEDMRACYCRLFELMLRYQYDCVISDLVFDCCEPEKARCVVLGTVEIVDGRLCRVCNTPRRYVWSFANLLPVAISTILTAGLEREAVEEPPLEERERWRGCCPDYGPFDCNCFLNEFDGDVSARYESAKAILRAAKAGFDSLAQGFAFTNSGMVSPEIFKNMEARRASEYARNLGLTTLSEKDGTAFPRLDPVQAFLSQMLLRPRDGVKLYPDHDGRVRHVLPDHVPEQDSEGGGDGQPHGGHAAPPPPPPEPPKPRPRPTRGRGRG